MHYLLSKLLQFNIQAKDGEMGKVKDIYFDEETNIRYAIVDTRKWLPEKKVLLPPSSFISVNEVDENLEVDYDKEMIRKSPPVPEETILTIEEENQLIRYFGWSSQWPNKSQKDEDIDDEQNTESTENPRMHSWMDMIGSRVHAVNGKLGRLRDLIFDENWQINYIVVQSSHLENEMYYLYPLQSIVTVDWYDGDFYLNKTTQVLEKEQTFQTKESLVHSLTAT